MSSWSDIVFELLEDKYINSCMCDGLRDAYNVLNGLIGMSEIMNITDEFILEAINASIKARNRYCSIYNMEEIGYVNLVDGEFVWDCDCWEVD